jgi:hypothetical protein
MAKQSIEPVYGFCPICGKIGVQRERRSDGNDKCENGHVYPSRDAIGVGLGLTASDGDEDV